MKKNYTKSDSFLKWNNKIRLLLISVILLTANFYGNAGIIYHDAEGVGYWSNNTTFTNAYVTEQGTASNSSGWTFSSTTPQVPILNVGTGSTGTTADDWLFSPRIPFLINQEFQISFTVATEVSGDGEINLGVYFGLVNNIAGITGPQGELIGDTTIDYSDNSTTITFTANSPSNAGLYIAFHNSSTATTGTANVTLLDWSIEAEGVWGSPYYYGWEDTDIDIDHFDDYWLLEDGNNNSDTWYRFDGIGLTNNDYAARLLYSNLGDGDQDEFMVSPGIAIDQTKPAHIRFVYASGSATYPENMHVYLKKGLGQNTDTTNAIKIADFVEFSTNSIITEFNYFVDVAQYNAPVFAGAGYYYLVFHCYSEEDMNFVIVDSVSITPVEYASFTATVTGTEPHGTVTPNSLDSFAGATIPIEIVPDRGYQIATISINGTPMPATDFSKVGGIISHILTAGDNDIEISFEPATIYEIPYFYDLDSVVVAGVTLTEDPINDHLMNNYSLINQGNLSQWNISNNTTYGSGIYFIHDELTTMSNTSTSDNWLFSPAFQLEKDKNYRIRFSARIHWGSQPRNLQVYMTTGRNQGSLVGTPIVNLTADSITTTYKKFSGTILGTNIPDVVPTDPMSDKYYFAFRSNNVEEDQEIFVDSIEIFEIATVNITASASSNGTVSPASISEALEGEVYAFVVTKDPGCWITSFTVNDVEQTNYSRIADIIYYTATNEDAVLAFTFGPKPTYDIPYYYGFEAADNPYPYHFEEEWNIYNANMDDKTWEKYADGGNYVARISYTPSGGQPHNDILVTPGINPPTDQTIKVAYKYRSYSATLTEKVNVILTKEAEQSQSMSPSLTVMNHTNMNNPSWQVQESYITPTQLATLGTTGKLFLKFHCYTDPDHWVAYIDSVSIETMPNVTVTASVGAEGGGTISPEGISSIYYNDNIEYTITPATGYMIETILIDGTPVENPTSPYTITNVTADRTIVATFRKLPRFISASVETDGGTITPTGNVEVQYGDDQTFVLTTDYGYELDEVLVNDQAVTITNNLYTFSNIIDSVQTIKVYFKKRMFNVTATSGANGSITPSGEFEYLDTVDFIITPIDDNYEIATFTVNNEPVAIAPNATSYRIGITQNTNVHVTFKQIVYSVTVNTTGNGTVSPSGTTIVNKGNDLDFIFTPMNEYYEVSQVLLNGVEVPKSDYADNILTISNIQNTYTLDVTFSYITYKVTISTNEGGTVDPEGEFTYLKGEDIYITLIPDNVNKELIALVINGQEIEYHDTVYNIIHIDKDYDIKAIFDDKSFFINATVDGGGFINPIGNVKVYINRDQDFVFEPWEGFEIDYVRINGKITETDGKTYRFRNVTANGSIYVYFRQTNPQALLIKSSTNGHGTILPKGGVAVTPGLNQTFTFEPDYGYELDVVYINNVATDIKGNSYTFRDVRDSSSIYVTFKPITYTVNVQTDCIGGTITPNGNLQLPFKSNEVFKFIPDDGYLLDAVFINGVKTDIYGNMYYVHVTENLEITANFIANDADRIITATAGENGTIDPAGDVSVTYLGSQKFTFIPNAEYKVENVLVDGNPVTFTNNEYEFTNVDNHHTIHVTFIEASSYTITTMIEGNGTIDPAGPFTKYEGESQLFTFKGNAYFAVDSVWVNDELVGTDRDFVSYEITNITKEMAIRVKFKDDTGGIIEDIASNKFKIFPNPTNAIVNLQGDLSEIIKIEVLNLDGGLVIEISNISNQLDLSKLPNGTYTIRLISKDRIENHSIIKIK